MSSRSVTRQRRRRDAVLAAVLALALAACGGGPSEYRFEGRTMGTRYLVHAFCDAPVAGIEERVAEVLEEVDDEMSTYKPDSALSGLNRAPVAEWVPVSESMRDVIDAALALSRSSDGAFDVTVGRLVNLWGFGPERRSGGPPSEAEIEAALERVGYQYLELRRDPPALRKKRDLYVDLSSIAKGHGVDRALERLDGLGCPSSLVEVGGDLRVGAAKPDGTPWRIGVEVPDEEERELVHRMLDLTGMAMATSGDYRNYTEWEQGERASHIIDPRSGRPAISELRSVTVLDSSAMRADGYATLIDVLGPEAGYAFAREHELPALLVVESGEGFEDRITRAMEVYLTAEPAQSHVE